MEIRLKLFESRVRGKGAMIRRQSTSSPIPSHGHRGKVDEQHSLKFKSVSFWHLCGAEDRRVGPGIPLTWWGEVRNRTMPVLSRENATLRAQLSSSSWHLPTYFRPEMPQRRRRRNLKELVGLQTMRYAEVPTDGIPPSLTQKRAVFLAKLNQTNLLIEVLKSGKPNPILVFMWHNNNRFFFGQGWNWDNFMLSTIKKLSIVFFERFLRLYQDITQEKILSCSKYSCGILFVICFSTQDRVGNN